MPLTILVVDDEIEQLKMIRRGLRSKGFGVHMALNAEQAICIIDQPRSKVDLVLTDYLMPGKDGIELTCEIREKYSTLPVIMMSAYRTGDLIRAMNEGLCSSFIPKPFTSADLMIEIKRALHNVSRQEKGAR